MGQPSPVTVTFTGCEAGWIHFRVDAAGQSAEVGATAYHDPFPEMVAWLHGMVTEATFAHWGVDQENRATSFLAARRSDGLARLLVMRFPHRIFDDIPVVPGQSHDWDRVLIDALVDPLQLAAAFFPAFDAFVHGDGYHPGQWGDIKLGRALAMALPGVGPGELAGLSAVDLALLANSVMSPAEWTGACGSLTDCLERKRQGWVPWAAYGGVPTDLIGVPEVPEDFDGLSIQARHNFLAEFLEERITPWGGADLRALLAGDTATAIRRHLTMGA
jgi:hypothetical protein